MPHHDVAIIIVSWHSAGWAIGCLDSLAAERLRAPGLFQVFVVDNHSGDYAPLCDAVAAAHWQDWVTVLAAASNDGFAAGCNLGMAHARAQCSPRYYHLLNPDTRVYPGAVQALAAFLDSHPAAGLAGSAFENGDGSDWPMAFRFPSVWSELEAGLACAPVSRWLGRHAVARTMRPQLQRVDWGAGASLMLRATLVAQVGGLDAAYFLYFEETEFCWRALRAGAPMWYVPASRVIHIAGQSTGLTGRGAAVRRLPAYWFESRRRYFLQTAGLPAACRIDAVALAAHLLGHAKRLLQGRGAESVPHYVRDLLHHSVLWPANRHLQPARVVLVNPSVSVQPAAGAVPAALAPVVPVAAVPTAARLGIVVIGRNEGARLAACLQSVQSVQSVQSAQPLASALVYVDSGSVDDSCALAAAAGCSVLALDPGRPFTAARARNAGFQRLLRRSPTLEYILFIDGDCTLAPDWPATAVQFLDHHPAAAVACGWRTERFPERSVYNRLCGIEWNGPAGPVPSCGGDAVMRCEAFNAVHGFREALICGEEPDLCLRLRRLGWTVVRLDAAMTVHDANLQHFGQWWQRNVRGGFAAAQAWSLHGGAPERAGVRASLSIWGWALLAPCAVLLAWLTAQALPLLMLLPYPLQMLRIAWRSGPSVRPQWAHGFFLVLGKFPQWLGQLRFLGQGVRRVPVALIEYK